MENRRTFLRKCLGGAVVLSAPAFSGCIKISTIRARVPMRSSEVKKAVVLWYSQTGYTRRNGRLLARTMEKKGIDVTASDLRDFDKRLIRDADIIVLGSPVFYYDTPEFVKTWIKSLPDLKGTPVAAYVTFGGPEGNQHNAACSILELLAEKQGVPVGIHTSMNMSSFPLSWSEKEVDKKTWMSRHLPNEETFNRVRQFGDTIIERAHKKESVVYAKKMTLREFSTFLGPIWWTKQFVKHHAIDREKCIECGTCVDKCPAGAIDPDVFTVDRKACVMCFGCINNCPVQAVHMDYNGEKVFGYQEFMKRKNLEIMEPPELA